MTTGLTRDEYSSRGRLSTVATMRRTTSSGTMKRLKASAPRKLPSASRIAGSLSFKAGSVASAVPGGTGFLGPVSTGAFAVTAGAGVGGEGDELWYSCTMNQAAPP